VWLTPIDLAIDKKMYLAPDNGLSTLQLHKRIATLNQTEKPKPAVGMVWFNFFFVRGERDGVERPLFDVLVGWHVVPSLEFFVAVLRFPVAPEDALFVAVDTAVFWTFALLTVVVDLDLVLLLTFFWREGDVAKGLGNFLGDWVKHEISSVMRIEMIARMTMMMSSVSTDVLRCVFVVINDALPI